MRHNDRNKGILRMLRRGEAPKDVAVEFDVTPNIVYKVARAAGVRLDGKD